jgi:hypothetical protein
MPSKEIIDLSEAEKRYETQIDPNSRIFLTQWFKDNAVGVGDTVCLWCVDWDSKKYVANVGRVGSGVVK